MAYMVTWAFGDGASETQNFNDETEARLTANRLSTKYALQYGRCNTQIHDGDRLVSDLTETYYS